jgi:hypothetical protein
MIHNYLWNLIVFIFLVTKDNQIIALLLSKLFFARISLRNCDSTGFLKPLSPVGVNIGVLEW